MKFLLNPAIVATVSGILTVLNYHVARSDNFVLFGVNMLIIILLNFADGVNRGSKK